MSEPEKEQETGDAEEVKNNDEDTVRAGTVWEARSIEEDEEDDDAPSENEQQSKSED